MERHERLFFKCKTVRIFSALKTRTSPNYMNIINRKIISRKKKLKEEPNKLFCISLMLVYFVLNDHFNLYLFLKAWSL